MPSKKALIIFDRCHPEQCDQGICLAAAACPRRLLQQESPYQIPMPDPSLCQGCGDCARACPRKAVRIVSM